MVKVVHLTHDAKITIITHTSKTIASYYYHYFSYYIIVITINCFYIISFIPLVIVEQLNI